MRAVSFNIVSVALLAAAGLMLVACTGDKKPDAEEGFFLKPTSFASLPGWQADDVAASMAALDKSCARIAKRPADKPFFALQSYAGTNADWQATCAARPEDITAARSYFETHFIPYEIWADAAAPDSREGLFTGYYEPTLYAATEGGTPLYARPDDLVTVDLGVFRPELKGESITGRVTAGKLIPYHTRAEIESGVIADAGKEIIRVNDPVDAFFLHIQGSGQVQMADGSMQRLGYAAQNGHKYVAIGRELIARGHMTKEQVTMQSIRQWLNDNPAEAAEMMNLNPSFVFFQPLTGEGPLGAEGVALTPGRSLAVDRRKIPYGVPVFIDISAPEGAGRITRLMVAQDTGGAIRGTVRGDFFWGAGDEAAHLAGLMKSRGHAWLLLPRTVVVPPDVLWQKPRRATRFNQ